MLASLDRFHLIVSSVSVFDVGIFVDMLDIASMIASDDVEMMKTLK